MNQKTRFSSLNLSWQDLLRCFKTHMLILKFTRRCEQLFNRWIQSHLLNLSQLQTEKQNMIGIIHLSSPNFQKRTFIRKVKSNLKNNRNSISDASQKQNSSKSLIDWWKRKRSMIKEESKDNENKLRKMNWDKMQSLK